MAWKTWIGAALVAAFAVPVAAQDYRASNRMVVSPQPDGSLVVSGQAELWAASYWCAVGEYARRVLNLDPTTAIFVASPYQRGIRTVTFGIDSGGATSAGVLVLGESIREAGSSISAGQAFGYCRDHVLRRSRD